MIKIKYCQNCIHSKIDKETWLITCDINSEVHYDWKCDKYKFNEALIEQGKRVLQEVDKILTDIMGEAKELNNYVIDEYKKHKAGE